jgi:hypothetical protein
MHIDIQKHYRLVFSKVYPLYIAKAERKGRTAAEVDEIICWLTGYDATQLNKEKESENTFELFFRHAPQIHPNANKITGLICGIRVEEIEDTIVQQIRYLDKLIDELAKGKSLEKILRK